MSDVPTNPNIIPQSLAPPPAITPLASGFLSSEFCISMVSILTAALTEILSGVPQALAKVSPVAGTIAAVIVPAVIGWIGNHYTSRRSGVKISHTAQEAAVALAQ